jgi:hypothetical protein
MRRIDYKIMKFRRRGYCIWAFLFGGIEKVLVRIKFRSEYLLIDADLVCK